MDRDSARSFDTSLRELKCLLAEKWADVYRTGRHFMRKGPLTAELFSGCVTRQLSLSYRDFPALEYLLQSCATEGSHEVDLEKLRKIVELEVNEAGKPKISLDLFDRFGIKLRPGTAPSPSRMHPGALRKYAIENHGPPYAVAGDTAFMVGYKRDAIDERRDGIRKMMLEISGGHPRMTTKAFAVAVKNIDINGVSRRETLELLRVLDPKKTGFVLIDDFCERFAKEYLKPKSLRSSLGATNYDGKTHAFEWPSSLVEETHPHPPSVARKMGTVRAASARGTRASELRKATGEFQRDFYDNAETRLQNWLMARSNIQRQEDASGRSKTNGKVPEPPKRGGTGVMHSPPSSARRVKTRVVADPVALGNVAGKVY